MIGGQFGLPTFVEPCEQASFEFLRSCADGSAVIGVGNFPEYRVAIAGLDAARVADGYVSVDLAMNQEDGDSRGCDGIFWRNLLHIEPVLRSDVEESEFDDRAEESASEPGAEVEGLAHAVEGDLSEAGERRFRGNGAEM